MTPQDLQIDWLKCFVAVVDTGSLSSAAGEVHRSQSAVSMQLKKLEDAVGRRLLDRGPRKPSRHEPGLSQPPSDNIRGAGYYAEDDDDAA